MKLYRFISYQLRFSANCLKAFVLSASNRIGMGGGTVVEVL